MYYVYTSKYAVHSTQIGLWKKQLLEGIPDIFGDSGKKEKAEQSQEMADLYEQIGRLKVENDYLKKKSSLFAG